MLMIPIGFNNILVWIKMKNKKADDPQINRFTINYII